MTCGHHTQVVTISVNYQGLSASVALGKVPNIKGGMMDIVVEIVVIEWSVVLMENLMMERWIRGLQTPFDVDTAF